MKWPLVSRRAYEERGAGLIRQQITHETRLREMEARYDDLLARYHMLRLNGGVPVAPSEPPKPVDAITAAIARASGGDPELRAMMEAQAMRDKREGKNDGDILAAIHLGQSASDGTFI